MSSNFGVCESTAIEINESGRTIGGANGFVDLTPREFNLLMCLVENAGCAMSRSELLRDAWHWDYADELQTKTVDMHVRRLRIKLERAGVDPHVVATVRGCGYAFVA